MRVAQPAGSTSVRPPAAALSTSTNAGLQHLSSTPLLPVPHTCLSSAASAPLLPAADAAPVCAWLYTRTKWVTWGVGRQGANVGEGITAEGSFRGQHHRRHYLQSALVLALTGQAGASPSRAAKMVCSPPADPSRPPAPPAQRLSWRWCVRCPSCASSAGTPWHRSTAPPRIAAGCDRRCACREAGEGGRRKKGIECG